MNLILLFEDDFVDERRALLKSRRFEHAGRVLRVQPGDRVAVGVAGGRTGHAEVVSIGADAMELLITLDAAPPPALPLTLVIALPRPKVLNRVVASAASLGIKEIYLINAWRVEKSYWSSPRLSPENLHTQCVIGLEQAKDTILPRIELRRLFRPFVEDELPAIAPSSMRLVAHPGAAVECPRGVTGPVTLVIGPEGGFIEQEIASLERAGFTPVSLGPRILRVETALAAIVGRVCLS